MIIDFYIFFFKGEVYKYLIHNNNYLNAYTIHYYISSNAYIIDYIISSVGVQKFSISDIIIDFYTSFLGRRMYKSFLSNILLIFM